MKSDTDGRAVVYVMAGDLDMSKQAATSTHSLYSVI